MLSRTWVVLAVLLAAAALFHGFTLLNYPATFVDEGWNASRSWGLLQTGHQFASVDSGVYQQFEGYWTYWPWLGTAIHAVAIKLLGLSLVTMREVSLVFGLVLLVILFQVGSTMVNRRTGLLAAAVLSVSLPFMYSSHMARHDIIAAVMGYGAIALQLSESRSEAAGWRALPYRSLLAGLLVGLSIDVHPNNLLFIPVMGLLYLMDSGRAIWKSKPLWAFVLGLAGGALYYAAMHVLPYPQAVAGIAALGNLGGRAPILFKADPALWLNAVRGVLWHLDFRMLPVILVAAMALIRRGSRSDRRVVLLFGAVVLAYMLVTSYKTYHYAIMIAPAAALLVAACVDLVLETPPRASLWSFARAVLVVGIVASVAFLNLLTVWRASNSGYDRTVEKIVQTIPEGASIIAAPTYWFARPYQPYVNFDQLELYRRRYPNSTLQDAFAFYKPDYFIMDGFIGYWLTDDPKLLNGEPLFPMLPKSEMERILSERGTLLGQVDTEPYGTVRIYKMSWQH